MFFPQNRRREPFAACVQFATQRQQYIHDMNGDGTIDEASANVPIKIYPTFFRNQEVNMKGLKDQGLVDFFTIIQAKSFLILFFSKRLVFMKKERRSCGRNIAF